MNAPASYTAAPPKTSLGHLGGVLWTLVRTDFKSRYHGTAGGFVWALLKPTLMFVVLMAVFSFIFGSAPHYRLNLVIGLFLWEFFSEGTRTGLMALHAKGYLLVRARFPAWILVVASISNALITLTVFVLALVAYLAVTRQLPSPAALAFFALYLALFAAMVVGFSLATSVLFLKYRDLNQVWDVAVQAGFFVAPIIYPLEILPERVHFYLYLWPPTPVLQFTRAVLLDGAIPTARANLMLAGVTALVLAAGAGIYKALAPDAAENL
jgi:lipopolysaccharide transport system permease protein